MKNLVLLFIVAFAFLMISGTNQQIIWFDKDLQITNQSEAVYYKLGTNLEGDITYYFKNKTVYREVFYTNRKPNGKFNEYFVTGELKEVGKYEKGLREGNWKVYYRNGKIRQKGKYTRDKKVGVWKTFYKNN